MQKGRHKMRVKLLAFFTGINISFLYFCAAYLAFSGHVMEALFYSAAVVASILLARHPRFETQGLRFR